MADDKKEVDIHIGFIPPQKDQQDVDIAEVKQVSLFKKLVAKKAASGSPNEVVRVTHLVANLSMNAPFTTLLIHQVDGAPLLTEPYSGTSNLLRNSKSKVLEREVATMNGGMFTASIRHAGALEVDAPTVKGLSHQDLIIAIVFNQSAAELADLKGHMDIALTAQTVVKRAATQTAPARKKRAKKPKAKKEKLQVLAPKPKPKPRAKKSAKAKTAAKKRAPKKRATKKTTANVL